MADAPTGRDHGGQLSNGADQDKDPRNAHAEHDTAGFGENRARWWGWCASLVSNERGCRAYQA